MLALHGRSKPPNVSSKSLKGKGKVHAILAPAINESLDSDSNAKAMPSNIFCPGNSNSNTASTSRHAASSSHPNFDALPNVNIDAGSSSSSAFIHPNFSMGSNSNIHALSSSAFNPSDFFICDANMAAMSSHLDIGINPSGINDFDASVMGFGDMYTPNGYQLGNGWDSYLH